MENTVPSSSVPDRDDTNATSEPSGADAEEASGDINARNRSQDAQSLRIGSVSHEPPSSVRGTETRVPRFAYVEDVDDVDYTPGAPAPTNTEVTSSSSPTPALASRHHPAFPDSSSTHSATVGTPSANVSSRRFLQEPSPSPDSDSQESWSNSGSDDDWRQPDDDIEPHYEYLIDNPFPSQRYYQDAEGVGHFEPERYVFSSEELTLPHEPTKLDQIFPGRWEPTPDGRRVRIKRPDRVPFHWSSPPYPPPSSDQLYNTYMRDYYHSPYQSTQGYPEQARDHATYITPSGVPLTSVEVGSSRRSRVAQLSMSPPSLSPASSSRESWGDSDEYPRIVDYRRDQGGLTPNVRLAPAGASAPSQPIPVPVPDLAPNTTSLTPLTSHVNEVPPSQPKKVVDPSTIVMFPLTSGHSETTIKHLPPSKHIWRRCWDEPVKLVSEAAETDLLVLDSIEHYADDRGESAITLISQQNSARIASPKESSATRWLHLTRESLNFENFENLVLYCPYISGHVRQVALGVLHEARNRMASAINSGPLSKTELVLRYDGKYMNDPVRPDESVIFFAMPHIVLKRPNKHGHLGESMLSARTLLQYLYNYDIGDKRGTHQIISRTKRKCGELLYVSQLWCILIGEGIILTCAELPRDQILGPNIIVDFKERVCTIRLVKSGSKHHFLTIQPPISYVEFLHLAADSAKLTEDMDILDSDMQPLTAETWLDLMELDDIDELTFTLRSRVLAPVTMTPEARMPSQGSVNGDMSRPRPPRSATSFSNRSHSRASSSHRSNRNMPIQALSVFSGYSQADFRAEMNMLSPLAAYGDEISVPSVSDEASSSFSDSELSQQSSDLDDGRGRKRERDTGKETASGGQTSSKRVEQSNQDIDDAHKTNQSSEAARRRPGVGVANPNVLSAKGSDAPGPSFQAKEEAKGEESSSNADSDHAVSPKRPDNDPTSNPHSIRSPVPSSRANSTAASRVGSRPGSQYGSSITLATLSRLHAVQRGSSHRLTAENLKENLRLQKMESKGMIVNDWASVSVYSQTYNVDSSSSETSVDMGVSRAPSLSDILSRRNSAIMHSGPASPPSDRVLSPGRSASASNRSRPVSITARSIAALHAQTDSPQRPLTRQQTSESSRSRNVRFNTPATTFKRRGSENIGDVGNSSRDTSVQSGGSSNMGISGLRGYAKSSHHPFFTWTVSHKQQSSLTGRDLVEKLLIRIDKTLSEEQSTQRIYLAAFECTLEELKMRHDFLRHVTQEPKRAEGLDAITSQSSTTGEVVNGSQVEDIDAPRESIPLRARQTCPAAAAASVQQQTTTLSQVTEQSTDANVTDSATNPSSSILNEANESLQQLYNISEKILEQFVPPDSAYKQWKDNVLKKYWGALDKTFRHVCVLVMLRGSQKVYIKSPIHHRASLIESLASHMNRRESDCEQCINKHEYPTIRQALDHLHSYHGHHHIHKMKFKPHDDPCLIWLRSNSAAPDDEPAVSEYLTMALSIVREVTDHLHELHDATSQLHMFFTVQPSSNTPLRSEDRRPPALVSHLVQAFENIVALQLHTAHQLSLVSRCRSHFPRSILEAGANRRREFDNAIVSLENAKRQLMLPGIATTATRGVNLEPVGPHYIMAVVVGHLQNRLLEPANEGKFAEVDMYSEYATKLQLHVNQRPQRRLFLDIRNLEEELDAMKMLAESQRNLQDRLKEVFDPDTYRITSTLRKDMFSLESEYIEKQKARLDHKQGRYRALNDKTKDLKEQVRQSIEILEEGHGKAIRVFTIVTLFFLPMSFISSFMGMNTADIRNSTENQGFFWILAVPVTVVVLVIAFVYAYQGDVIAEFIDEMLDKWRNRHPRRTHPTALSVPGNLGELDGNTLVGEKHVGPSTVRASAAVKRVGHVLRRSRQAVTGSKANISRRTTEESVGV